MEKRIANLDTLRAFAILMVLIFHVSQIYAEQFPGIWWFTRAGFVGVDLFFAISGYLIGSLFFFEWLRQGRVNIARFIIRRISRTVPPYLIALTFSWLAVYYYRGEPFNPGYLLFFQNYYEQIPFFLVSWSLCVEEHFYLILPVFLTLCLMGLKKPAPGFALIFILLSIVPLWLRYGYQDITPKPFGFYQTATHLNFDPLIFGVGFSYLAAYSGFLLKPLLRARFVIYISTILLVLSYSWWPEIWMYSFGKYLLGFSFAITVAVASEDCDWPVSGLKLIPVIAVSSYAIYLTHALLLHVLVRVIESLWMPNLLVQMLFMSLSCLFIGYAFYKLFDRPVQEMRKKWIPARNY